MICHFCETKLDEDHAYTFDDIVMCEDCYHERTVVCDSCGTVLWREDAVEDGDADLCLCRRCYEDNYETCEHCGHIIRSEDAYYVGDAPYCSECYDEISERSIHPYSYKPSPIFYGTGPLYLGVELEIDRGGEDSGNAEQLLDIGNLREERIYCKHDGSLGDGFEIVSHPMSLLYHRECMNWEDILHTAVSLGYLSHKTTTCGLHIHCSRSFFGSGWREQENSIARIVFFVENHWNELVKFSRRQEAQLDRWASRYGISENTQITYQKTKNHSKGRYVAVNLENDDTIEFRLFRGTLNFNTFLATLELVDEICRQALRLSDYETEHQSWGDFVLSIPEDKKELLSYLKAKRLYVNETDTEGDDF